MTLFLSICLAVSAALVLGVTAIEASAIRQRINGANGLMFLVAFIVSALSTLPVAVVVWWFGSGGLALGTLLGSGLWHLALWNFVKWRLQSVIDRTVAKDKAKA